jgi:hypothetical protein
MTTLGKEEDLIASMPDRAPDLGLALGVAFGGIDHVEPGIKRRVEQAIHVGLGRIFEADFGSAEAERAHPPTKTTQGAWFHHFGV